MSEENHEHRLKRLAMRSMRRGIKEMDLILQDYAGARLADMSADQLDLYERMLEESDHDLYAWVSGLGEVSPEYAPLIADIQKRLPQHRR